MRLPLPSSDTLPLADRSFANGFPAGHGSSTGSSDTGSPGSPEDELQNWSSLIGIITAICGNILIALALNVQRYAHIRLHRRRREIRERARQALKNAAAASVGRYGTAGTSGPGHIDGASPSLMEDNFAPIDPRFSSETDPLAQSFQSDSSTDNASIPPKNPPSSYLKDPYWWLGQVLITIGELGNFLAYGFAPASIVSPLGVVALISNCIIAPIFFKELFRARDFWGVLVAVVGAVTVVLSAKTEETKLGPHEVWDAITTIEFEIYMAVTFALIALLMWLSPRYGSRTILIDLGLVGLFGGYTALSTKGVSSMLSSTLLGAFTTPVTYALIFVLLLTAIMQVRYLNKALQRFASTQVIPVQFVLFTLSVIIGSAVLYRDFERTTRDQAVKFVGGCLFTFFGVFVITSGRPRQTDDDDEDEITLSDAEGIEETIGLAEHDRLRPTSSARPRTSPAAVGSRSSSRASRASGLAGTPKSLADIFSQGYRSARGLPTSAAPARNPIFFGGASGDDDDDYDESEHAPLLANPWHSDNGSSVHPSRLRTTDAVPAVDGSLPPSTASARSYDSAGEDGIIDDSILAAAASTNPPSQSRPNLSRQASSRSKRLSRHPSSIYDNTFSATSTSRTPNYLSRPSTPPPSHPHPNTMYSPSPFSSTLNAVVGDKLLSAFDGGLTITTTANAAGDEFDPPRSRSAAAVEAGESSNSGGGLGSALAGLNLSLPSFGFGLGGGTTISMPAALGLSSPSRRRRSCSVEGVSLVDNAHGRGHELGFQGGHGGGGGGGDDGTGNAAPSGTVGGGGGLRGRARSLSQTLSEVILNGGWFSGATGDVGGAGREGDVARQRPRTAAPASGSGAAAALAAALAATENLERGGSGGGRR
ncbi:hypothetical protein VTJ04DRAFT_328 [Mycothermus thermophilus]|uniref:uncharacterized protein n=1 Tax=Humicola insolens TaxID=85995 RepID=UPI0037439134